MFQTCPPSQSIRRGRRVCGDVEAVGFPVQNVYKMTYGDKNATFEPVNGYGLLIQPFHIAFIGFGFV